MGGKGQKRREKNFLAAHGGYSRLPPPPPPKSNELDTIPSKLRKLLRFKNNPKNPNNKQASFSQAQIQTNDNNKRKRSSLDEADAKPSKKADANKADLEKGDNIGETTAKDAVKGSDLSDKKKKKKRSRKMVEDLRFVNADQALVSSKRKERRKEYLESKKRKHKLHQKEKTNDIRDFPGREQIKFGDIVQAPPKLSLPKAAVAFMDAAKERARLQAIEAYRNRKGWASRPGLQPSSLV